MPHSCPVKACSCLITCPTTVTKDKRRTIKEKTTETSYAIATRFVDYTEIFPNTHANRKMHTLSLQPPPPPLYFKATNATPVDNKYIQAYPDPRWGYPTLKVPNFIDSKDAAVNGTVYAWNGGYNYFQLFYFMDRRLYEEVSYPPVPNGNSPSTASDIYPNKQKPTTAVNETGTLAEWPIAILSGIPFGGAS
ncbi:hypothetical protein DL95DRAFT_411956 [Leptodontidium sp. 2 PMI_412]|nr:hypothetical protein DL95DRAFT_411956 [Leptodontidium sp. 2 PMI_412]